MSGTLQEGSLFLIDTLFNLYLFILVIRLMLAFVRADYFNPMTQFALRLSDFMIKPMKRIVPNIGSIESATLIVIFLLEIIKFTLIIFISYGSFNIVGLLIESCADILYLIIQTFTYAIILQALLSLIQPQSPFMYTLHRITSPILRPIQRVLPLIGGFDLSPIPALIILQLLKIMLVFPLMAQGNNMMMQGL